MLNRITILFVLLLLDYASIAQALSVSSCPQVDKLNNGNGQAASSAGQFSNGQNNAVANNVAGTEYQTVEFDPSVKTGNYILKWPSSTPLTNLPVVTRVWITINGVSTLSNVVFGPPPPAYYSNGYYYINYSFYGTNLPNAGKVTIEFTDPVTGLPAFTCTFDLATGTSTATPPITCTPTINTHPSAVTSCGSGTASFITSSVGTSTYQWQYSSNNGVSWTNITQGGNFTTVNLTTLTVANTSSYSGYLFREVLTNSCGSSNTNSALLTVNPIPTAAFSGSTSLCGLNTTRSLGISLTGTAPWSITYTTNGTPTTVSGITTSPYYISVTPSATTTYTITSVSDANCSNSSLTGSTSVSVNPTPSISPTNATACMGASSFALAYTSSNSPNQYAISTGTRALSGFSAVSTTALTASPMSISIPTSGNSAGTYDFTLTASNSSTGCSSTSTFTLSLNQTPTVTASASATSVCSGGATTLTGAGASTYSWSPSTFLNTTAGATVTANPTASTTYTVTGTASNGCTSTGTVSITATSTFSVSISASTTSTCSGGQAILTASGANTYSWTGPSSYTATGSSIAVSPSSTGTYTVTGTDANGCTASASQTITITGGPNITVSSNVTICAGSSTTLTASGGTTYYWTPSSTLSTSTGSSVTATPSTTTTYIVYGTTGGCTNSASVTVTVTQSPVTSVPNQVVYCAGDYSGNNTLDLTVTTNPAQTFTWSRSTDGATWSNSFTGNYSIVGSTTNVTSTKIAIKSPGTGDAYYRVQFTYNSCTFTYDMITLKKLGTVASDVSSNQTICSGSTPTTLTSLGTTYPGSGTTLSMQWQSSTDNTTYTDISGQTSTTYSPGVITQDTWYRVKFTTTGSACTGPYYSNTAKITIATAIASNTLILSDACTGGTQISGSSPSGGTGSFTYTWWKSTTSSSAGFTEINGATSQSYTPPVATVTTWYKRLVTSGSCTNTESNVVVVYPPLSSVQISNGQSICSGASLTSLSVSPAGGASGSYTYVWQSSTNNSTFNSTGTTTSSYAPPTTVGTNYYRVIVTDGSCSATSNSATITVNALPTVTISASSAAVCSGNTTTLTASGAVSYSWSPATYLNVTSGAVVTSTPTAAITYTVTGSSAAGCTNSANQALTYATSPSDPTLSGGSGTICSNNTPFDLSTLVTSGAGTYEWYTVPSTDATYKLASSSVSSSGTYYIYKKSGSCYSTGYASYTLTIHDVSALTPNSTSVSVCSPNTVNLTTLEPLAATGTTLLWYTDNTHTTAVSTPTTASAGTYYLFAYSSSGSCYGPASTAVTITVNSLPTISLASSNLTTCTPSSVDLDNAINVSGGITYRWYTTNSSPPSSANLVSAPDAITSNGTYYVFAFNNTTSCISSAASTVTTTFTTTPEASLTAPTALCLGAAQSIAVSITNGVASPTYQWQLYDSGTDSWSNLSAGGVYSNVTSSTLSISSNTGLDGAAYRCVITKNGCSTNSNVGVIGINVPVAPSVSVTHPNCTTATGTATVTSYAEGLTFSLDGGAYQSSTTFSGITQNTSNHSIIAKNDVTCTSSGTSFNVNAQPIVPTAANAGPDQSTTTNCAAATVTLAGNNPSVGTGLWSQVSGSGGSFNNTSTYNTTFTGLPGNSYILKWTTSNDTCNSSDNVTITLCNNTTSLPIELLYFDGVPTTSKVLLNWATATEHHSSHFILSKSQTGVTFTALDTIPAAGNSDKLTNYSSVDNRPLSGISYYKLDQFDLDGNQTTFFKSINYIDSYKICVLPNPMEGNLLTIELRSATPNQTKEISKINLYNTIGNELIIENYTSNQSYTDVLLSNQLAPGIYLLGITLETGEYISTKFIAK